MSIHETFPQVVRKNKFVEYCDYYDLDVKETKRAFIERGYIIKAY